LDLAVVIQNYGYPAVFVGTFLEGETILVLGGFAAHRGYLSLPGVVTAAFAGSLLGDQLFFFLGRFQGRRLLKRLPSWGPKIKRAHAFLETYPTLSILTFRFLYGLRTVVPFAIGSSKVSALRFGVLNVCGAAVWSVAIGLGGYYFGRALELLIEDVKRYELLAMGAVALAGLAVWGVRALRRRRIGSSGPR
jgi:membrane protein DedA with SNARE-associated domain